MRSKDIEKAKNNFFINTLKKNAFTKEKNLFKAKINFFLFNSIILKCSLKFF